MEKEQIGVTFLYEFKLGTKAAETARKINNAFGPDTVQAVQCNFLVQKVSEDESLEDK